LPFSERDIIDFVSNVSQAGIPVNKHDQESQQSFLSHKVLLLLLNLRICGNPRKLQDYIIPRDNFRCPT
jgi:hypothetical protein